MECFEIETQPPPYGLKPPPLRFKGDKSISIPQFLPQLQELSENKYSLSNFKCFQHTMSSWEFTKKICLRFQVTRTGSSCLGASLICLLVALPFFYLFIHLSFFTSIKLLARHDY